MSPPDDNGGVAVITFDRSLRPPELFVRIQQETASAISRGFRFILIDLQSAPLSLTPLEIGALFNASQKVRPLGGRVGILRPPAKVRKLFQKMKLDTVIPIYDDEATACASIKTNGQSSDK